MNEVQLVGRLVKDAEMKVYGDFVVVTATIAVDMDLSKAKKAELKAKGEPTADFPQIRILGKFAEAFVNFTQKGSLVEICGSISTRRYKGADGEMKYTTDVLVRRYKFLDFKSDFVETKETDLQSQYDNVEL